MGGVQDGAHRGRAVVGAHAHQGVVAHDVHEAAEQAVFHFIDVAFHLFGAGAYFGVLAVQIAQPAVIEPVDGMRVHVEQAPVGIGLDQALDGVPEPCAVEFH